MDWKSFLDKPKKDFVNLNKEIPDTFKGFSYGKRGEKNGSVDEKTK